MKYTIKTSCSGTLDLNEEEAFMLQKAIVSMISKHKRNIGRLKRNNDKPRLRYAEDSIKSYIGFYNELGIATGMNYDDYLKRQEERKEDK